MGYLVESEQTMKLMSKKSSEVLLLHYFFYDPGEPQEKTFGGLLHAIVHQLLVGFHAKNRATLSQLYELLKPHLSSDLTLKKALPDRILVKILHELVAQCQEPLRVCLFIDGFDECHGDHGEQMDILTELVRSSSNETLTVRACIASRVETEIQFRLSNEPTLAIHKFTGKDISAFVSSKLRASWDLMGKLPDGTTALYDGNLVDDVVEKADGVFVWVKVVVSLLAVGIEQEAETGDLYSLLADLPKDLEDLYSSILHKIDQKLWPDTINFLRLVQAHNSSGYWRYRALQINLLAISCAIQDPMSAVTSKASYDSGFTINDASLPHNQCAQVKRRMQRSCRGLIEIGDAEDLPSARLTLLHRTVSEYLESSQRFKDMLEKVDKRSLRDPAVAEMTTLLRFLKCYPHYEPREPWRKDANGHSLIEYFFAAMSSAEQRTATSQSAYMEELDRVLSLINPNWTKSYYGSLPFNTSGLGSDTLSLAVYHGLTFYLQHQIGTHGKDIIKKRRGPPLLFCAVDGLNALKMGDENNPLFTTYEILLSNGADPMENFEIITPWSYLLNRLPGLVYYDTHSSIITSIKSSVKPFRLMLEHGADPTQRVSKNILNHEMMFAPWPVEVQAKQHTTTFHMLLISLKNWSDAKDAFIKLLIDHSNDLEATDSDGIRIQEWADYLNRDMGALVRQEIAAKKQRLRRRIE